MARVSTRLTSYAVVWTAVLTSALLLAVLVRVHRAAAEGTDSRESTVAAVIEREKAHNEALSKLDGAYLDGSYTDDATYLLEMSPNLETSSRTWQAAFRNASEVSYHFVFGMTHEHVQVYGDVAVLCYRQTTMNEQHSDWSSVKKVTVVCVRQQGVWKEAHRHASAVPEHPLVPLK